jgi:hypothetical protein
LTVRAIRPGERVLIVAAVVAIAAFLGLRTERRADAPRAETRNEPAQAAAAPQPPEAPAEEAPAAAVVAGTVSGKYGPIAAVLVVARSRGEIVAETTTDLLGGYRLVVPAGADLDLEARPVPETELAPARRIILPLPGEELTVDFQLGAGARASVVVDGPFYFDIDLVAIPVEDYPLEPDPASIGALEAAPKVGARMVGIGTTEPDRTATFAFEGLDPAATYRLAVLHRHWALDRPVVFRAGDENISARVEPVLRLFVEATDIETGEPLPRFRVALTNEAGTVLETFEASNGRLSRCLPQPKRGEADDLRPEKLVISADGYLDQKRPAEGVHRVALQRAREPNVRLDIAYDDGTPCDTEIETRFESLEDPDGLMDALLRKDGPGRFRTTLPPGKWRLHVKRPKAFHAVTRIADVEVPGDGTVDVALQYRRGGTVTLDGHAKLERDVDGERQQFLVEEGTWEDVPPGTWRVMAGETEYSTFDVVPGTSQAVRVPPYRYEPRPRKPEPEDED